MVLLVVVADCHVCTQTDGSAVRGQKLVDDLQDGRFSRAVVADHCHVLALF